MGGAGQNAVPGRGPLAVAGTAGEHGEEHGEHVRSRHLP